MRGTPGVRGFARVRRRKDPHRPQALGLPGNCLERVSKIADLQQMSLQLVVGDEPLTVYQSDTVPEGARFPRIALPISIHGGFCLDTVIEMARVRCTPPSPILGAGLTESEAYERNV